ncbi:MAG: hypothetical protein P9M07_04860 [Candidatus Aceula meridiana]|nr:hypothetical protein [Candidatus Aceula meridiana]
MRSCIRQIRILFNTRTTFFVVCVSLVIAGCFIAMTWDMLPFPTDADVYYLKTAKNIFDVHFISEIHKGFDNNHQVWLHGKEVLFFLLAIFQRIFKDYETLNPLVILLTLSFAGSAVLIFLILRNYFGRAVGLICYFVFITCVWSFLYLLFPKHQPLGLLNFLLAFYLLQVSSIYLRKNFFLIFSGCFLCLSLHSSPTSMAYLPYYAAAFLYHEKCFTLFQSFRWSLLRGLLVHFFLFFLGFAAIFICFNYPNILYNIKSYFYYVYLNCDSNHFYYNQPILQQWISGDVVHARGGWIWIFKYFILIMPILFPVIIVCVFYLLFQGIVKESWKDKIRIFFLIGVVWLPVLFMEIRGISQYGANYYPVLVGLIFLLAYGLSHIMRLNLSESHRRVLKIFGSFILFLHILFNVYLFGTDIFPCRMAKNYISKKIEQISDRKIYTYKRYPFWEEFTQNLSQGALDKMNYINNIYQVSEGAILIPPVTTKAIYNFYENYSDFDLDIFLNEILERNILEKYAIASFQTIASSRIWVHEEEVLSYMYLVKGIFTDKDLEKGKAWIIDAKRLKQDAEQILPRKEFENLVFNGIRNIGTKSSIYKFFGFSFEISKPQALNELPQRIYKVGNPEDGLVAYLYYKSKEGPYYLPYGENFSSKIVSAREISNNPDGQNVSFHFPQQSILSQGSYYVVIYRTGAESNEDFYRIYLDNVDMKNFYILQTMNTVF